MAQTRNLQAVLQLDSLQAQAVFLMNYSDAMAMQDSMRARAERGEGNVKRVPLNEEELRVRREVMKQRRLQRDEQMKGILSPEQYEKYTEYMKKAAENRRPFGRAPRRGAPQAGEQ